MKTVYLQEIPCSHSSELNKQRKRDGWLFLSDDQTALKPQLFFPTIGALYDISEMGYS